jgi:hypothetical protein
MKRPTRKDIVPSLYGDETINNNRYANELEKYVEYLENKANDSEVIHSVMPRESDFKKALELLRDLAEIQNGSPMHKDADEWQDIMSNIWDFLTAHES